MEEGKLHCSLVMALFLTTASNCDETTQQYLQNAVRSLKNLRNIQTLRRADIALAARSTKERVGNRRSHQFAEEVPPLTLTKGELAVLYESAVAKGETINFDTGENEYIHAAVHHLEDDPSESQAVNIYSGKKDVENHDVTGNEKDDAGYYYYYYPIKSFLDEITSQPSGSALSNQKNEQPRKETTTYRPPFQYHSHHHQHNVTIKTETEKMETKPMEPLFMAISGFIGMAVMYVLSMIVLPKFGMKPKLNGTKKKEKFDDFARLALNAIEGHCAERFACELTKTARTFQVEENRFYKLLRRMVPGTLGRYMNNAGKYANKHLKCTAIPCTKKRPNNNKKTNNTNQKKKNNANKKH